MEPRGLLSKYKEEHNHWLYRRIRIYQKCQYDQQKNTREVSEIPQDTLPPVFTFHHNFYPKPEIDLEDAKIPEETENKLQVLKQDYYEIAGQHSRDIGITHLEEMTTETDPQLPPVASKLYPLPLKCHEFVKKKSKMY